MSHLRFHGDPKRFEVIADYIDFNYRNKVHYIADIAGGQGMLSRLLNKRGYEAEVIDPRSWTLVGVRSRAEKYTPSMADFYDMVVGLHPDQALRAVVESSSSKPIIVVPCCNFWDETKKLGQHELLGAIEAYFNAHRVKYKKVKFAFDGPNNIGFATIR